MPKQRFYGLLVDRSDTDLKPKWWGFGKEIYQQLLEALLSDDYANFMDPYDGLDADVRVVVKAGKTEYSAPQLTFKRKESKLAPDGQKLEQVMSNIFPFEQVFNPITESEISERLSQWMNMSEEDGEETVKGQTTEQNISTETSFKDVDDAFEAALKE